MNKAGSVPKYNFFFYFFILLVLGCLLLLSVYLFGKKIITPQFYLLLNILFISLIIFITIKIDKKDKN
jgi:hypothetical protein